MKNLKNIVLISLGWLFVVIGAIGIFLPIVPTTPFMILALGLFANSSPRFHAMLLNNRWIGDDLKRWEKFKCMKTKTKLRAMSLILVTFLISILMLMDNINLQIMLVIIGLILLFFLSRVNVCKPKL